MFLLISNSLAEWSAKKISISKRHLRECFESVTQTLRDRDSSSVRHESRCDEFPDVCR